MEVAAWVAARAMVGSGFDVASTNAQNTNRTTPKHSLNKRKNLAAPILTEKGQFFDHTSPLFSPDALHRTQKAARLLKNCLLFRFKTAA